jgi:hypothetical protein
MTDMQALARAARPAMFDTVFEPELLHVLVLANLMSASLWTMRDKILERNKARAHPEAQSPKLGLALDALDYVNRHFTHLIQMDVVELIGVIDLDRERQRLGADVVDRALEVVIRNFHLRTASGQFTERNNVLPQIAQGQIPNYTYMSLEGLHARRNVLPNVHHKPVGVSICADEATLNIAVLMSLGVASFQDYAILGSAAHYNVLCFGTKDLVFWSNGKREFFDQEQWHRCVDDDGNGDPQLAVDRRAPTIDRIVTPRGAALLTESKSTLSRSELLRISNKCKQFFGASLTQFRKTQDPEFPAATEPTAPDPFATLNDLDGVETARRAIGTLAVSRPGSVFDKAFYCLRDIRVPHPEAYVLAGMNALLVQEFARELVSFDQALAKVQDLPGEQPWRDTPDHLSLPEETLLFKGGGPRDKALLLFTLLLLAPSLRDAARQGAELTFTAKHALVHWNGRCFDMAKQQWCAPIGNILLHVSGQVDAFKTD